jgi:hypothetical protein
VNSRENIGEFTVPADQQGDVKKSADSNKFESASNACEQRAVYHKFNASTRQANEKLSWNWTIKNAHGALAGKGEANFVTFR